MQLRFESENTVKLFCVRAAFGRTYLLTQNSKVACPEGSPFDAAFAQLRKELPKGEFAVDMGVGQDFVVFVTNLGNVYTAGDNKKGQLGRLDRSPVLRALPQFSKKGLLGTRVVSVACGRAHTLALTESGAVYSWGHGFKGQLGSRGAPGLRYAPEFVVDLELAPVVHICARNDASGALTDDGFAYVWGRVLVKTKLRPDPVSLPEKEHGKAVDLDVGYAHFLVATEDNVYAAGYNYRGQLGIDDKDSSSVRNVPVRIKALSGISVRRVFCGRFSSAALTRDGELYTWGSNSSDKLGLGDDAGLVVPAPRLVSAVKSRPVTTVALGNSTTTTVSPSRLTWLDPTTRVVMCSGGTEVRVRGFGLYKTQRPPFVRFGVPQSRKSPPVCEGELVAGEAKGSSRSGVFVRTPSFAFMPPAKFPIRDVRVQVSLDGSYYSNAVRVDVVSPPPADSLRALAPFCGPVAGGTRVEIKGDFCDSAGYAARVRVVFPGATPSEVPAEFDRKARSFFFTMPAAPANATARIDQKAASERARASEPDTAVAPKFDPIPGGVARLSDPALRVADVYLALDGQSFVDFGHQFVACDLAATGPTPPGLGLGGGAILALQASGFAFPSKLSVRIKATQFVFTPAPFPAPLKDATAEPEGDDAKKDAGDAEVAPEGGNAAADGEAKQAEPTKEQLIEAAEREVQTFQAQLDEGYPQQIEAFLEMARQARRAGNDARFAKGAFARAYQIRASYESHRERREADEKATREAAAAGKSGLESKARAAVESLVKGVLQKLADDAKAARDAAAEEAKGAEGGDDTKANGGAEPAEEPPAPTACSLSQIQKALLAEEPDEKLVAALRALPDAAIAILKPAVAGGALETYTAEQWWTGAADEKDEDFDDEDEDGTTLPGESGVRGLLAPLLAAVDDRVRAELEAKERPDEGTGRGVVSFKVPNLECLGACTLRVEASQNGSDFSDLGIELAAAPPTIASLEPRQIVLGGDSRKLRVVCKNLEPVDAKVKVALRMLPAAGGDEKTPEPVIIDAKAVEGRPGVVEVDLPENIAESSAVSRNALFVSMSVEQTLRPVPPRRVPLVCLPAVSAEGLDLSTVQGAPGTETTVTGAGLWGGLDALGPSPARAKFVATVDGKTVEALADCEWKEVDAPAEEAPEGDATPVLSLADRVRVATGLDLKPGSLAFKAPVLEGDPKGVDAEVFVALDGQNFVKLAKTFKYAE